MATSDSTIARPTAAAAVWLALALLVPTPLLAGTVLVVGDSLSSGYGIPSARGWVSMLAQRLAPEHRVVNASISGDTTLGGRTRLSAALRSHRPSLVLIELGGNDGLRGLPLETIRANLDAMIRASREAGAEVVLLGMRIPPNFGRRYADQFHAIYPALACEHDVRLVPFLLEGIATRPELMQGDGIHPTASAQPLILDNVWPVLAPLLAPT